MKFLLVVIILTYILTKFLTAKLRQDLEHEKEMRDLEKLKHKKEVAEYQEKIGLLQRQIDVFRRVK